MQTTPFRLPCPRCAAVFTFTAALLGKRGRCSKCQHVFLLEKPLPLEEDTEDEYQLQEEASSANNEFIPITATIVPDPISKAPVAAPTPAKPTPASASAAPPLTDAQQFANRVMQNAMQKQQENKEQEIQLYGTPQRGIFSILFGALLLLIGISSLIMRFFKAPTDGPIYSTGLTPIVAGVSLIGYGLTCLSYHSQK